MKEFILNLSNIFEDTNLEDLNPSTQFKNLPEWDSMSALMLIVMFDQKYSIKITPNNIANCETINDLYQMTL